MPRVLIVEDERTLLKALAMNLIARGYDVTEADTGGQALTAAATTEPDVVILDLGLPDITGLDVIKAVRAYAMTPIIVLSARSGSSDKVAALDLGADDYVTKPFNIDELLARVRAATRRASTTEQRSVVRIGAVTVDLEAVTAVGEDGMRLHLTPTEWRLLTLLIRQSGKLVTTRALLDELRGAGARADASYLRLYMSQLRRKLEPEPSRPRHLLTEPAMGYRFQA